MVYAYILPFLEGFFGGLSLYSTCTAWVKVSEEPREPVRAWVDEDNRNFNKTSLFVEIFDNSGRRTESYDWVVDRRIDTKFWTCAVSKVEIIRSDRVVQVVAPKIVGGCPQWVVDRRE